MIVLLALMAAGLGATGVGLCAVGVYMAVQGEIAPGMLSLAVGLLTFVGTYLFGRAAFRVRRGLIDRPLNSVEKRERRANVRTIVVFACVLAAGALTAPVPTEARVVGVIVAALMVPLVIAVDFEPPKKPRNDR